MKLSIAILFCLILIGCRPQAVLSSTPPTFQMVRMQDFDNELPFWIGTWVGETNNRRLTLTFTLFQKKHFIDGSENYYKDKVVGKFKVEDLLTNTVLYDTSSASQYSEYPVNTSVFRNIALSCIFQDDASLCFNTATFKLFKISGQQNQVQYKAFSRHS